MAKKTSKGFGGEQMPSSKKPKDIKQQQKENPQGQELHILPVRHITNDDVNKNEIAKILSNLPNKNPVKIVLEIAGYYPKAMEFLNWFLVQKKGQLDPSASNQDILNLFISQSPNTSAEEKKQLSEDIEFILSPFRKELITQIALHSKDLQIHLECFDLPKNSTNYNFLEITQIFNKHISNNLVSLKQEIDDGYKFYSIWNDIFFEILQFLRDETIKANFLESKNNNPNTNYALIIGAGHQELFNSLSEHFKVSKNELPETFLESSYRRLIKSTISGKEPMQKSFFQKKVNSVTDWQNCLTQLSQIIIPQIKNYKSFWQEIQKLHNMQTLNSIFVVAAAMNQTIVLQGEFYLVQKLFDQIYKNLEEKQRDQVFMKIIDSYNNLVKNPSDTNKVALILEIKQIILQSNILASQEIDGKVKKLAIDFCSKR
jgi:hypothetical protein